PLHITAKLIVKGRLRVPEGSVLDSDVKADRSLDVGPYSTCRGNVIAGGDIVLGPSVTFADVIHAGRSLWLSSGVRVSDPMRPWWPMPPGGCTPRKTSSPTKRSRPANA